MVRRRSKEFDEIPLLKPRSSIELSNAPFGTEGGDESSLDIMPESGFDDSCELSSNVVQECSTIPGTESQLSAVTNLSKCICGAGSFALPHVFLEEGVIGGTIALVACGLLSTYTMKSLSQSKIVLGEDASSYVELARNTLGVTAARIVFVLTLSASLGVCSSYIIFIGQTLQSLSCDASSTNIIRQIFPDVSLLNLEITTAALLFPLCLLRSYRIFAFTSALGVIAVVGGIIVTILSGILVEPGGGLLNSITAVGSQPMFPSSLASAFGGSFGTVAFLFCINFLTFPIMNSMKEPGEYDKAVEYAVTGAAFFNVVFAILCLGFYGDQTQDLVLSNLRNGPYLSALKILLCVDLFFTYPIVFSSGRQIAENFFVDAFPRLQNPGKELFATRVGVAGLGVLLSFQLAQIGGFGTVANLVGGVAQGTLAFVMPPMIAVVLAKRGNGVLDSGGELGQWALGVFGVFVVLSTSYFTVDKVFGG